MGTGNPKLYSVPIAIKIRYGILNYSTNCLNIICISYSMSFGSK